VAETTGRNAGLGDGRTKKLLEVLFTDGTTMPVHVSLPAGLRIVSSGQKCCDAMVHFSAHAILAFIRPLLLRMFLYHSFGKLFSRIYLQW
jgi:hypothetical protein